MTLIPMIKVRGFVRGLNARWVDARNTLTLTQEFFAPPRRPKATSAYLPRVLQGATLVPRGFWFVRRPPKALVVSGRAPQVETDPDLETQSKEPWKSLKMRGAVEAEFIYATVLSDDLLPFALRKIRPVVIPMLRAASKYKGGGTDTTLFKPSSAAERGYTKLGEWLRRVEREYQRRKKTTTTMSFLERLDYDGLLQRQVPEAGFKVLYNRAGTHIASCVIDVGSIRTAGGLGVRGFIVDNVAYAIDVSSTDEAHYLCAFLNAPYVDEAIKPFQTKGLFGAKSGGGERDIHRRPFEIVPIPIFDKEHDLHLRLVALSRASHEKAAKVSRALHPTVGRARQEIRVLLGAQLREIDDLVRAILSVPAAQGQAVSPELQEPGDTQQRFDLSVGNGQDETNK